MWRRAPGTVAASSRGDVKEEIKALFLVHLSAEAASEETERVHLCHLSRETEEDSLLEESHFDHHSRESRRVHRGTFPLDILNENNNG